MLFRILVLTGAGLAAAMENGGVLSGAALAAALAAGQVQQRWERSGEDGKDGTQSGRVSDSRVHRYAREVGFRRPNQRAIDADPRSAAVYEQLRHDPKKRRSHARRVDQWSIFERYVLVYHPDRSYAQFLRDCEEGAMTESNERLLFQVRTAVGFPCACMCLFATVIRFAAAHAGT